MKKFTISSICFLLINNFAHAIPSYPRDLECETNEGLRITLSSNNGFWSQAENGRYSTTLSIGNSAKINPVWINFKSGHTRGNDVGERQYIFSNIDGETFFVQLEFKAPYGEAVGIQNFSVMSSKIQFSHSQPRLKGEVCNVKYYPRIEI